ncbi:MAG: phosphoenolpyruvate--protein phosphotransferase [Melioribacteraceae bacterium]|nr:phosphoenolpyruvate--protein phosphotransferase [Melioribacteraceae bacterium]
MKQESNKILDGIPAAPGIAIANAFLFKKEIEAVNEEHITDVPEAIDNLKEAIDKSKKELSKVFSLAVDKLGEKRAAIFEAQIMVLDDPILLDNITKRIEIEKRTPEYIVYDEISKYQAIMAASKEAYMKERSQDIEDIKNRIIRNLRKKKWRSKITSEVIVVADSLTPADTVLFSKMNVKGYVTNFGGLTSHAAIVARSLDIPAVVGLHDATEKINHKDLIIIDGFHGEVIINPSDKKLKIYKKKINKLHQIDEELAKLKDEPAETLDGINISILANLDVLEELPLIIQNGAKGVGLLRTEQIFQGLNAFPSEEEQSKIYTEFAEILYPNILTIRSFDIGGDKVLPFDVKEPNPMLGWRGIRFMLDNLELFKTQIRSIFRASSHKNVKFMLPMISSLSEVHKTKRIISECKVELRKEGYEFDDNMEVGIMIEVPSAALMIRDFAKEVDFFSIGTNDLIQYLLAVDRGNEIVTNQYQEFHPAIIRTLNFIIVEAKKSGTCVSLCGEMAADFKAIPLLVGLGLDSLSVSGSAIPYTKKIIRNLYYSEAKALVQECLLCETERGIHDLVDKFYSDNFKEDSDEFLAH